MVVDRRLLQVHEDPDQVRVIPDYRQQLGIQRDVMRFRVYADQTGLLPIGEVWIRCEARILWRLEAYFTEQSS